MSFTFVRGLMNGLMTGLLDALGGPLTDEGTIPPPPTGGAFDDQAFSNAFDIS